MRTGRLWAIMALTGMVSAAIGQIELLDSFDPAEGGAMNSIGFNRDTDEIFVHFSGNASIHVYDRRGSSFARSPSPAA